MNPSRPDHRHRKIPSAVGITLALMLSGCTLGGTSMTSPSTDPARPFNNTRPADIVQNTFYDTIDDIVTQSGIPFPTWNRQTEDGVRLEPCGESNTSGQQLSVSFEAGGTENPDTAIQAMRKHWESLGYTIGNTFTDMGGNTTARQINAYPPQGGLVQYTPGKTRTYIDAKSECSFDPEFTKLPTPTTTTTPTD